MHSVAPTECTDGNDTLCVDPSRPWCLQNLHHVEERFEPALDSLKINLEMRAELTNSRPGRCTAMIVETLAGLGVTAPACQ